MEEKNMDDGAGLACTWLHRHQEPVCLVFFAGWGMDARPFTLLGAGGVDVCMLSGYRRLEPPVLAELQQYEEVILLAWSFGVWMAAQVCPWPIRAACSEVIALGGTLQPVDARFGLAPARFDAILAGFNAENLHAFYRAMFDDPAHLELFLENAPRRGLDDLRAELAFLHQASLETPTALDIFSQHVITARDRIFSGRNQARAWGKAAESITMPWPHFPFYHFATWGDLLSALRPQAGL